MPKEKKTIIGIIGSADPTKEQEALAFEVGKEIAARNAVIICGGLSGVMEASCQGAKQNGGLTIGILPGASILDANPYIDIAIPTGMGEGRNLIIIRASQALIAIGGGYGTLSEIAFALKLNKPVIGLVTWELNKISMEPLKIIPAKDPQDAVNKALKGGLYE